MLLPDVQTPAVLIDTQIATANVQKFQSYCNGLKLNTRPHIKTHKLPHLARQQIAAGAIGITCQKISEASAMIAQGGIDDVLITYNIIGEDKLAALRDLASRVRLSVVADSRTVIDGLSAAFAGTPPLTVLVECDTGAGRCGVQTAEQALALARLIDAAPGLTFGGLMTYPPKGRPAQVNIWLSQAKSLIEASGLSVDTVSTGGTPDMWQADAVPVATEWRAGTYIYNDRSLVERDVCGYDDCALTVLATVVSRPTDHRAIVDAGSKILTSDLLGLSGHGHVLGHPAIAIDQLSEEHGRLVSEAPIPLKVGDRIRIVPNHACVVSNMVDRVALISEGRLERFETVAARGRLI